MASRLTSNPHHKRVALSINTADELREQLQHNPGGWRDDQDLAIGNSNQDTLTYRSLTPSVQ